MKKLTTSKVLEALQQQIPPEVFEHCLHTLSTLDEAYGEDRTETDLGGFVALCEEREDFEVLKSYNLDIMTDVAEFVDIIETDLVTYISILYLLSSDFAIKVVASKELIPKELLETLEV